WGERIADYLNQRLDEQNRASRIVLNLASEEYFKSVNLDTLRAKVVQCVFQQYKNGAWKIISFNAKRARGLMARYIIEHRIDKPGKALQGFDVQGYCYAPEVSDADKFVFRRRLE